MSTIYEGLRPLKLLGSLLEVVRIFFRKDGKKIEWKPNQSHTYAADMTYEFPAPDTATTESDILVSEKSEQTLKNKTINFNPLVGGNTAQDIPLSSLKTDNTQSGKVVMRDGSGIMTHGQVAESQLDGTLASKINAKAEQADLEAIEDDVAVLQSAVAAKASNNTVNALDTRVQSLEADPVTKAYVDNAIGNVDLSAVDNRLTALEADPTTKAYVDGQISALVNSAPATLNTLKEIADQLASDESTAAALATTVASKASQSDLTALTSRVSSLEGNMDLEVVNTDWVTADGTSKTVSHSLGTDVQVQIFDKSNGQILLVDTIEVTATTVVLTASEAPGAIGWRVTIQKNA